MNRNVTIGLIGSGGSGWIGGLEYTRNLISAVRTAEKGGGTPSRLVLLTDQPEERLFADVELDQCLALPKQSFSLIERVRRRIRIPTRERDLDNLCRREGIEFLYPYDSSVRPVSCRSAAWIPDFQHHRLPEYFSQSELALRTACYRNIALRADLVLSSHSALRDFREFYPDATSRVTVLPFRVSVTPAALAKNPWETVTRYHIPRKYLLVSNQLWQHKNHLLLLEAIARLKSDLPDLTVVLTGRLHDHRHPDFVEQVAARIQTLGIHDHVRLLGLIPKGDQIQLLRAAHAMVQPSLFEGWNTGVEEARLLGKVVLMSNIDVHREQSPPGGRFFEARDATDLASRMRAVWEEQIPEWSREPEQTAIDAYQPLVAEYGKRFLSLAGGAAATFTEAG